jgi:hypothetical protein
MSNEMVTLTLDVDDIGVVAFALVTAEEVYRSVPRGDVFNQSVKTDLNRVAKKVRGQIDSQVR